MALDFDVISLEKKDGVYIARIKFCNTEGDYEISSNANIRYNDFILDKRFRLSILDGFDISFNELPYIRIKALSFGCEKNERALEKAFFEFIKKACNEGE